MSHARIAHDQGRTATAVANVSTPEESERVLGQLAGRYQRLSDDIDAAGYTVADIASEAGRRHSRDASASVVVGRSSRWRDG